MEEEGKLGVDQTRTGDVDLGRTNDLTNVNDTVPLSDPTIQEESGDQLNEEEESATPEELVEEAHRVLTGGAASAPSNSRSVRRSKNRAGKKARRDSKKARKRENSTGDDVVAVNPYLGYFIKLGFQSEDVCSQAVQQLDAEGTFSELLKEAGYENLWVTPQTTEGLIRALSFRTDTTQILRDIEALTSTGLFQLDFSVNRHEARLAWELLLTLPRDIRSAAITGQPPEILPPTGFDGEVLKRPTEPDSAMYKGLKPPRSLRKSDPQAYEQDMAYYEAQRAKYDTLKKAYDDQLDAYEDQQKLFQRELSKDPARAEEWEQYQITKKLTSRISKKVSPNLSVEYRDSSRYDTYDQKTRTQSQLTAETQDSAADQASSSAANEADRQQLLTRLLDEDLWLNGPEGQLRGLLEMAIQAEETAPLKPLIKKHWTTRNSLLTELGFDEQGNYVLFIEDKTYTTGIQRFMAGVKGVLQVIGALGFVAGVRSEKSIDLQAIAPLLDSTGGLRLEERERDPKTLKEKLYSLFGNVKTVDTILQLTGWGPAQLLTTLHSGVEAGKKIEQAMKIGDNSVESLQLIQDVLNGQGLEDKSRSEDPNDANKIILQRDDITGSTSLSVPMLPIASQSAIFGDKTVKMKTSLLRGLKAELKGDRSASQSRYIAVSLAEISLNDLMITTPDGIFNIGNISLAEFSFEAHAPDGRPRSVLEKFLTSVGQIVRDLSLRIMKFLPINGLFKAGAAVADIGFNGYQMFKDFKAFDKGFEAVNFRFNEFNLSDLSTSSGDYVGNINVGKSALELTSDNVMMGNYSDPIALEKELKRLQRDLERTDRRLQRSNPSARGHNDLVRKQEWLQSEVARVTHLQEVHTKVYPLERRVILLQRQGAQLQEQAGEQPSEAQKQQLTSIQAEIATLQTQINAIKFDGVSAKGQIGAVNVSDVDAAGVKIESVTAAETTIEANTNEEGEAEAGFTATNEKITLTGLEMRDPNRIDESLQNQKSALLESGTAALQDNLSKRNALFARLSDQAKGIAENNNQPSLNAQVAQFTSAFSIADPKATAQEIFDAFKNGDGDTLLASFDESCALELDALLAIVEGLPAPDGQALQASIEALYTFQNQMRTQLQQIAQQGDELRDKRQDLEPLLQEYQILRARLTDTSNPLSREEQARYMQLHNRLHEQTPSTSVDKATIEGASFSVGMDNMNDLMGSTTDDKGNTTNTTDVSGVDASINARSITVEGLRMDGTSIDKITSTDASLSFDGSKTDGAVSISSGNTTIEGIRTEGIGDQYTRDQSDNSTELAEVQAEIDRINAKPTKTSEDSSRLELLQQRLETLKGNQADLAIQGGGQQSLRDFLTESAPIVQNLSAWPHSNGRAIDFSRGMNAKAAHEAVTELETAFNQKRSQLQTVSNDVQTYSKGTEAVRAEYAQYVAQKKQAEADIKDRPFDKAMVAQRQELITALDDKIAELQGYLSTGEGILKTNEDTQLQLLNSLEVDRANLQKAKGLAQTYDSLVELARSKGVDPSKLGLTLGLNEMSAAGIQRAAQAQIDAWDGMSIDKVSFAGSVEVDNLSQLDALKDMFGPSTADPTKTPAEGTNVGLDVSSLSVEGVRQGDKEILSSLNLGNLQGQVVLKDANTISIPDISLGELTMEGLDWGDPSMGFAAPIMSLKGIRVSADIAFDPITGAMGNATLNSLTVAEAKAEGKTTFRYEDYLIDMEQMSIQGTEKDPGISLSGVDLSNFALSSLDLNNVDIQGLGVDMGAGLTVAGSSIKAQNANIKSIFTPAARARIDRENRDAMRDGEELTGDMANKYAFDLSGVDARDLGIKMETMGLDMKLDSVQGDAKGMDYDLETEVFNFRDLDLSNVKIGGITYDAPDMLFQAPGGMDLSGIKISGRYEMKTGRTVLDQVYAQEAAIGYLQYKTPGPNGMDVSLQEANASKFNMTNFIFDEGGMDLKMDLGQSDVSGLAFKMGDQLNGATLKGGFELNSLGFEMLRDGDMSVDFNGVSSKAGEDISLGYMANGRDVDGNTTEMGASVNGGRLNNASGHVEMKDGQTIFQDISVGELGVEDLGWHSIAGAGNMMNVHANGASLKDIKVSGRLVEKEPKEVAGMKLPTSDIFIDHFSVATIDADKLTYTDSNNIRVDLSRSKDGQAMLRGLNVTDLKMIDGQLEDGNLGIEHVGTALDFKQSGNVGGRFQEILSSSSTVEAEGLWATFDKGVINGGVESLEVDNTSLDWDMSGGTLNISPLHARILGLDGGMDTSEFGEDSPHAEDFARNNAMRANVDEIEVVDDAPITYTSKPGSREPSVELKEMNPQMYNELKSSWFKDTDEIDERRQQEYWNSLSDEDRAKMQDEAAARRQDQENTSEFVQAIDKNVLNTISGSIRVDMTMQAQALLETVESVIKIASGAATGRPGGILSGIWNQLKLSYNVIKEKFTGKKEWRSYQVIEIVDGQVKGDLGSIVGLAVGLSQGISRGADAMGELGEAFGATGKALWESTPIDLVMMLWSDQQRDEFNQAWSQSNKEWADVMDAFGDIADIFTKLRNGELNNLAALENEFGLLDSATDPDDEEEILEEMLAEITKVPDPDSSALSWLDNNLIGMTIDSVDVNLSTKPFKLDNLPNNTSITVPAAQITASTTSISKGRLSIRGNINLSGLEFSSGEESDRTEASLGSADVKLPSIGLSTWTRPEGRYDQYKATIGGGSRFRNLSFYRNKFVKNL